MKKLNVILAAGVMAASAGAANAAVHYASSVVDYTQGGCTVAVKCTPDRYVATNALGASDGNFVSLGHGGSMTVGFDVPQFPGNQFVKAWEITYSAINANDPHREAVDVYAVMGGVDTLLGRLTNQGGGVKSVIATVAFEYIKLVDATLDEFGPWGPIGSGGTTSFDGYDVDSISVAPVPLPAAGLMLLAGLGGFAALRRRKGAAAA